jgi:hypothetical protein
MERRSAKKAYMTTQAHKTTDLGDLIAATFEEAALYSADPQEVSNLATQAVAHMLLRARRTSAWQAPPAECVNGSSLWRQELRRACLSVALLEQFRVRSCS